MTKREIVAAIKGAAAAALTLASFWLILALADMGGLF